MSSAPELWRRIDHASFLRVLKRGVLVTLALNVAALVSPIFFTQVYDRVLTTGSTSTLLVLVAIALVAIGIAAAFEQVRTTALTRASAGLYADLEAQVYRASHSQSLSGRPGRRSQAFDDLEHLRATVSGPLPGAALDILFAPVFLGVLFLIHFWTGVFAVVALALVAGLATLTQWAISASMQKSLASQARAAGLAESQLRGAEAAAAMGFVEAGLRRWSHVSRDAVREQVAAAASASGLIAVARGVRSGAQILIIALAAALALQGQVSAGAIIAASIILARLLAPVDQLLGGWKQLTQARNAANRLSQLLEAAPAPGPSTAFTPRGRLVVDDVSARTAEGLPLLRDISFRLEPGEILAVIGPVGAGKSTLLRCALGIWPLMEGVVRLDGVPLPVADRDQIGRHLGFLPQSADLLPGTVAENICRFGDAEPQAIMRAIETAGARDIVSCLPAGPDTDVGEAGVMLSAGQRRRIALARALYGDPCFVCLDEPEAHLDREGEMALQRTVQALKARGAAVLIAAHRPSVVALADRVMVLNEGRIVKLGPTSEVLKAVTPQPLRQVAG
jgi:PrtD family type I secretion system ABC transporter